MNINEQPPQTTNIENNNERPLSPEECEKSRDEKLEKLYSRIGGVIEREKTEFLDDTLNVLRGFGGIFEKMGK